MQVENNKRLNFNMLDEINISVLKNELFEDGNFQLLSQKRLANYSGDYFIKVCSDMGMYQIPTQELIAFLKEWVVEGETIEVAAGRGIIGKELGIPCTDSMVQKTDKVRKIMLDSNVVPVVYGEHVEKLDALAAIKKYKPSVVIASWLTGHTDMNGNALNMYGCNEEDFIDDVDTYILIGNESAHFTKSLLTRKHREYRAKWLFSRGIDQRQNRIFIWSKNPISLNAKKFGFKMKLSKVNPKDRLKIYRGVSHSNPKINF